MKDMKSHKVGKKPQRKDYEYEQEKRLKRKQEKVNRDSRKNRRNKWQDKEE